MPGQAVKLVDRMKADSKIDMENDWKVITLFVGGNDLCDYCDDKVYFSFHSYVRAMYTPLNPSFILQNWGMQGFTYFSYFCSKT